jgi:hypothetical protein
MVSLILNLAVPPCRLPYRLRFFINIFFKGKQGIDFHNRAIPVQRNVTRGKTMSSKSRSSKRSVRTTAKLVPVLQDHQKHVKETKLEKGWEAMVE